MAIMFTKFAGKKLGHSFYLIVVPALSGLCILCAFLIVGSAGVGRLPTGVGETCFLIGIELGFACFQIIQTSLSSIFSTVIPPEFIVSLNFHFLFNWCIIYTYKYLFNLFLDSYDAYNIIYYSFR